MELKRHNKNGKKYNINKDFRGGERRLYRHPQVNKMENSDVSSDGECFIIRIVNRSL